MHPEIKNIATALLGVVLIPAAYALLIYGSFKLVLNINIEGIAISLFAIILWVTAEILLEQQKQQLTKKQFIKKIYTHTIVMVSILVTITVFSYAQNYV